LIDGFTHRGEYGRALEIALSNVEVHPNDGGWHAYLAYVYLHTGKYKEMIEELQHTVTLYGYPEMALPLGRAYATSGYRSALRLWADDLAAAQHNPACPSMVAEIYAHLGDSDMAFKWLERAYQERDGFLLSLRDPDWQVLRADPRFKDLVRRVGLPP
jgi:adenylate cyclase